VAPSLITSQPKLRLALVINSSGVLGTSRNAVVEAETPDSATSGLYFDKDDNQHVLLTSLNNLNTFPMKVVIGDVYFHVPLTANEYVGGWTLLVV